MKKTLLNEIYNAYQAETAASTQLSAVSRYQLIIF